MSRCIVLLVEDNPGDVGLMRAALREMRFPVQLHVAADGLTALRFLHREEDYAQAPRPDLIVLDLNLPPPHGLEILAAVKHEPPLQLIPVVIFTSSSEPTDIRTSYRLGASAYLQKPLELGAYLARVKGLLGLWCQHALFPPR